MQSIPTRHGLTLLETMIGAMIMAMVLYTTAQSLRTGSQLSQATLDTALTEADAGRILHDIAIDLRSADKAYLYDTSGTKENVFSFTLCSGFNEETGAPDYTNTDNKVTIVYNKSEGTLTKYLLGGTSEGILLSDQVAVPSDFDASEPIKLGFSVTAIGTDIGSSTLSGSRAQLRLVLIRNRGTADEVISTAERVVFLRSWLFNSDGLDGSASNDTKTDPSNPTLPGYQVINDPYNTEGDPAYDPYADPQHPYYVDPSDPTQASYDPKKDPYNTTGNPNYDPYADPEHPYYIEPDATDPSDPSNPDYDPTKDPYNKSGSPTYNPYADPTHPYYDVLRDPYNTEKDPAYDPYSDPKNPNYIEKQPVNWEAEHPATDESPDAALVYGITGAHPPTVSFTGDQSSATSTFIDSAGDSHTVPMILTRITLSAPTITYPGKGNKDATAVATLNVQDVSLYLPNHHEDQYSISYKVPSNGNKEETVAAGSDVSAEKIYIDVYGPQIGEFSVSLKASTRGQTVDGQTFEPSTIQTTNSF